MWIVSSLSGCTVIIYLSRRPFEAPPCYAGGSLQHDAV